jgi:hypothetical protein
MKRLPALLTMSMISAVVLVAWTLTVDVWVDAFGMRKAAAPSSRPSAVVPAAAFESASRASLGAPRSRPASRRSVRTMLVDLDEDERAGVVTGRIVSHAEHDPAPKALVRLELLDQDGFTWRLPAVAGEDGRFAVAIPKAAFKAATLDVETPRHSGLRRVEVAGPWEGVRKLGDVELAEFRTVWLAVLTPNGDPVPRAMVRLDSDARVLAISDDAGCAVFDVKPPYGKLRICAFGYEVTDVAVPPHEDSLKVRLDPAAVLLVHVTTPLGDTSADAIALEISGEVPPCTVRPQDAAWLHIGNTSGCDWDASSLRFRATADVRISCVTPNAKLTVRARDARLAAPSDQGEAVEVVTLAPGERRRLELVLRGEYRRIRGRVLGEGGVVLRGARVSLLPSNARPLFRPVSPDGWFDFGITAEAEVHLEVESLGYARWIGPKTALPKEGLGTIHLDRGRSVVVTVVDEDGQLLEGAHVQALGRPASVTAGGRPTLEHMPQDTFTVEVRYRDLRGSADCPAGASTVTVKLDQR